MLLTEKEAAEKWCPHVRIAVLAGHGGASCNTHPDPKIDEDCRCAGSRCAMWRWKPGTSPETEPPEPKARGYCGLAGKPEGV